MLDRGAQSKYLATMRGFMLGCQESDGSWTDWPMTAPHKTYGAALGVMTLYHMTIEDRGLQVLK